MADFRPRNERVKTALDNRKLNLSAPCPGVAGKYSNLQWMLMANNPRIVVWTNDPNDTGESKGYGKITANLDLPTFMAFLNLLNKVIDKEGEYKDKIENLNYIFPKGKRSEKPVLVSELWVGKDKDGIIWMSITAPANQQRPRIKFPFAPSNFHNWIHGDGTPYSSPEVSKLYAQGYANLLQNMMVHVACENFVDTTPTNTGGGNTSSGHGGGSSRDDDGGVENDIPF